MAGRKRVATSAQVPPVFWWTPRATLFHLNRASALQVLPTERGSKFVMQMGIRPECEKTDLTIQIHMPTQEHRFRMPMSLASKTRMEHHGFH